MTAVKVIILTTTDAVQPMTKTSPKLNLHFNAEPWYRETQLRFIWHPKGLSLGELSVKLGSTLVPFRGIISGWRQNLIAKSRSCTCICRNLPTICQSFYDLMTISGNNSSAWRRPVKTTPFSSRNMYSKVTLATHPEDQLTLPTPTTEIQPSYLSNTWWRHQMETFSAWLAICAGNSPVPGEFPPQRPVTRSFDVFFDLRLNKRLSKQSWGWWFEMLSRPLWRHCNGLIRPVNGCNPI